MGNDMKQLLLYAHILGSDKFNPFDMQMDRKNMKIWEIWNHIWYLNNQFKKYPCE